MKQNTISSVRKKKILTLVGSRPQFIKTSQISPLLRNHFNELLVHSGQHYDYLMSKIFFKDLKIPEPDYNLEVGSGSHAYQTANIMIELEKVINKFKPELIIVFGDTNTTLAGAVVASKMNIPIAHIESGLRSYNKKMPEELNRICIDHCSEFLFCPGKYSVSNLKKENISGKIYNVGDVMKDALLKFSNYLDYDYLVRKYHIEKEKYYFFTLHRQENTKDIIRLKKILKIIEKSRYKIVFCIHPGTKNVIRKEGIKIGKNIEIIEPVSYVESLAFQKFSKIVITDSGGIQKEAYLLGVPCIILRNETEWIETIESGRNILSDDNIKSFKKAENASLKINHRNKIALFYGNGKASEKINNILIKNLY